MKKEKITADRLSAFSDGVFAVIVTVMVLEQRAPDQATFAALLPLWPTVISYAVSYLFIAVIWINHHYLMQFVNVPTLKSMWINFAHLFMVSLLPFATAWGVTYPTWIITRHVLRRGLRVCGYCI